MCHQFTIFNTQLIVDVAQGLQEDNPQQALFRIADRFADATTEFNVAHNATTRAYPGSNATIICAQDSKANSLKTSGFGASASKSNNSALNPSRMSSSNSNNLGSNALEVKEKRWGFQTTTRPNLIYNTRAESALQGMPLWQEPLEHGRCIVCARSYFEYHQNQTYIDAQTRKKRKALYEFTPVDEPCLLMAGISCADCFSIITQPAQDDIASIHHRMPLLLSAQEAQAWLQNECFWREMLSASHQHMLHAKTTAPCKQDAVEEQLAFDFQ